MMRQLRIVLWFAKRPMMWGVLGQMVMNKISPPPNTRAESGQWCAGIAVDTSTAMEKIAGGFTAPPVRQTFADYFAQGEAIAAKCPVKMGGAGDLELLYGCAEFLKAQKVLETGVAYGWSSLAILLSLKGRPGARLISTDMPYPGLDNEPYVGCVVPDALRPQWTLLRRPDRRGLPQALDALGGLDMCHYDSDKSYKGRMWAYPLLWSALRPGGLFLSDDIGDNVAFRDFCAQLKREPIVVEHEGKYIGVLVKPA